MTVLEQAYTEMQRLPEEQVVAILQLIRVMNTQDTSARHVDKRTASRRLKALRAENAKLYPADFDFDAARDEAMREKYGSFD